MKSFRRAYKNLINGSEETPPGRCLTTLSLHYLCRRKTDSLLENFRATWSQPVKVEALLVDDKRAFKDNVFTWEMNIGT